MVSVCAPAGGVVVPEHSKGGTVYDIMERAVCQVELPYGLLCKDWSHLWIVLEDH